MTDKGERRNKVQMGKRKQKIIIVKPNYTTNYTKCG